MQRVDLSVDFLNLFAAFLKRQAGLRPFQFLDPSLETVRDQVAEEPVEGIRTEDDSGIRDFTIEVGDRLYATLFKNPLMVGEVGGAPILCPFRSEQGRVELAATLSIRNTSESRLLNVLDMAKASGLNQTVIEYSYDALSRLTEANYSDGTYFHYTHDAVGNRLSQDVGGVVTDYSYDNANRLTEAGDVDYTWDDNGNLLNDGVYTYSYDHANRLVGISAAGTVDIAGAASISLDGIGLSAAGTVADYFIAGVADITLESVGIAAAGTVDVAGAAAITLDGIGISAAGAVAISGTTGLGLYEAIQALTPRA